MTPVPDLASFSEFAVIANVKPAYVTQLRKAGRLVLSDDGKRVQVAASLQLIKDTADPARRAVALHHAAQRAAKAPGTGAPGDDEGAAEVDPGTAQFQNARAQREHWNSLTAKMEYEKSIGKLLDADQVEATVSGAVTIFRSRFEMLPQILAPQLAPISDEAQLASILTNEFAHMLEELSRQFATLAKATP